MKVHGYWEESSIMSGDFDELRSILSWRYRFIIPAALAVVTIASGMVGTYQYLSRHPGYDNLSLLYMLLESFITAAGFLVANSGPFQVSETVPAAVYLGRITGLLFLSYAALLGFTLVFANRLKPLRVQMWNAVDQLGSDEGDSGHVLICGLGDKGYDLALDHLKRGNRVVGIDTDTTTSEGLEATEHGAILLDGDARLAHTLKRARLRMAKEVYINCGDDRTNAEVLQTVINLLSDHHESGELTSTDDTIDCYIHQESNRKRRFLHDQLEERPYIRLHTYDTANATARELLQRRPVDRFATNPDASGVHVLLVGWSKITKAILVQLLHEMHYFPAYNRSIVVLCKSPEETAAAFRREYPAIVPEKWDDTRTQEFIDELFPALEFSQLPKSESVLLSDRRDLFNSVSSGELVSVFVAGDDGFDSGSWVSSLLPRLKDIEDRNDVDLEVNYYVEQTRRTSTGIQDLDFESARFEIQAFSEFVDGCDADSIKGNERDERAKQLAAFYHLLYDTDIESIAQSHGWSMDTEGYSDDAVDRVLDFWDQLESEQHDSLLEEVWVTVCSEEERDSNRFASDHIDTKCGLATANADTYSHDELIERLKQTEHRRWCAERFLEGWEPIPVDHDNWGTSQEASLREQKYHRALHPLRVLEREVPEEADKDISQVEFVLQHFCSPGISSNST